MSRDNDSQMTMRRVLSIAAFLCSATCAPAEIPASWTNPVEPTRVVGNVHYVGTEDLGSWLIVGKDGAILLDAPLDDNVALILRNVEKLGYDPAKIRILLNSHAHLDHAGGLAKIKKATGAKLYLSAQDAELAARGGRNDFAFGDTLAYPPVKADAIVGDGETIRLGDIAMTAILTPGHTKGCTTWRTTVLEGGKPLTVLFLGSLSAPGYTLIDNDKYPRILDDYRRSFDKLRDLDVDVFLANHGSFFDLTAKLKKKAEGRANPFIDRTEFPAFLEGTRSSIEKEAAQQRSRNANE